MKFAVNDVEAQRLIGLNTAAVERNTAVLTEIRDLLVRAARPPRPQNLKFTQTGENPGMSQLTFQVNVDPPSPGTDVTTQQLTVFVNGSPQMPVTASNGVFPPVSVPQGNSIRFDVVNIDDAGNASPVLSSGDFVANDTIPPPAPTGLNFSLTGETG